MQEIDLVVTARYTASRSLKGAGKSTPEARTSHRTPPCSTLLRGGGFDNL
jgi:hypothetical protein